MDLAGSSIKPALLLQGTGIPRSQTPVSNQPEPRFLTRLNSHRLRFSEDLPDRTSFSLDEQIIPSKDSSLDGKANSFVDAAKQHVHLSVRCAVLSSRAQSSNPLQQYT